eukprot:5196017-Lingulodinium_polyedra.AAC.1
MQVGHPGVLVNKNERVHSGAHGFQVVFHAWPRAYFFNLPSRVSGGRVQRRPNKQRAATPV